MSGKEWYKDWFNSSYYHKLYFERDEKEAQQFIKRLLDYLNVHYVEERLVHNEIKNIDDTKFEIHRWQDNKKFCKKIIITNPALNQPQEFTEQVAKLNLGDFTDMLSFQNMQVIAVFGDYNLNQYDIRKTPRMIIVARKLKHPL